jgi:hypothetical protein
MKHKDKLQWMQKWSKKNGATLDLEGICGFGRECVGILINGIYPEYNSFDDNYKRIDKNGYVWSPRDAYHKHPCVCVLGRGKEAESQLYEWLMWFDDNNFCIESGEIQGLFSEIELILCENVYTKMTKQGEK